MNNEPYRKNGFWRSQTFVAMLIFVVGELVMFAVGYSGYLIQRGREEQVFSSVLTDISDIKASIKRMDTDGPQWSRWKFEANDKEIATIVFHLDKTDQTMRDYNVPLLQATVARLDNDLRDLKATHK